MLVNLGVDGFSGVKMSMRQTFSEFNPEKLCFGVKIEILILAKIEENKEIARIFFL
jgi:hypothetical protein